MWQRPWILRYHVGKLRLNLSGCYVGCKLSFQSEEATTGVVILGLVLSNRKEWTNNMKRGLLAKAVTNWFVRKNDIQQLQKQTRKTLPLHHHHQTQEISANSGNRLKVFLKNDLRINVCRYVCSLCRKITLHAHIVPNEGKNRPLHLEIFNDWLSKSNHTEKESKVI